MKLFHWLKPIYLPFISTFLAYSAMAQVKLTVSGAKVNMTNAVYLNTNAISVNNTGFVNVDSSTLKIADSIKSSGAIDLRNGTLEMYGTAPQAIPANSLTANIIKNLTVSGTDNVTVGGPLALTDVLTVSGGSLSSAATLTLKSISTKTARVAPVTTNAAVPIIGDVVVERYISSKRAFRFLTAPVNTTGNIRANWMENTNNPSIYVNNNPVPNFGTHITGVEGGTNGFDATITNLPSLFTYDNLNQTWVAATNTNSTLNVGKAYRILVRGSRSTDITQGAPPSSVTTLRATGTLATRTIVMAKPGGGGTAGMPELSNTTGGFSLVGNPYASPVDWVLIEKTNIASTIYIWDPTLSGTNGRGAYVSYNSNTGVSNIASLIDNNIQSGQSFLVETTAADPSLTFREEHKSVVHRAVFRTPNHTPNISLQLLLPGQDTLKQAADGLAAYFSNDFSNAAGDEDSYKLVNLDENIAIAHNGSLFSIEGRKTVSANDTLPLKIWQLTSKKYLFKSVLTNFEDADAYLEDDYLHSSTKLSNQSSTIIPFTINTDSLSFAKNRFRIVFKTHTALAVTMSGVKAFIKNSGIEVEWITQSGSNTDKFIVEKSSDAQTFEAAGAVNANTSTAAGLLSTYNWFDENPFNGDNYYRIKWLEKSGEVKYSKVVKVYIESMEGTITVVTGPAKSNFFNIIFKNVRRANYALGLINNAGQKVYSGVIAHNGGSATEVIKLKSFLPVGIYHLQVSGDNKLRNIPVLIQ